MKLTSALFAAAGVLSGCAFTAGFVEPKPAESAFAPKHGEVDVVIDPRIPDEFIVASAADLKSLEVSQYRASLQRGARNAFARQLLANPAEATLTIIKAEPKIVKMAPIAQVINGVPYTNYEVKCQLAYAATLKTAQGAFDFEGKIDSEESASDVFHAETLLRSGLEAMLAALRERVDAALSQRREEGKK